MGGWQAGFGFGAKGAQQRCCSLEHDSGKPVHASEHHV